MFWSPTGIEMAPELHPDVWMGQYKFQMSYLNLPNNISSMKYALKSVHGLADVVVLHGDGDSPRTPARCLEESGNFFK